MARRWSNAMRALIIQFLVARDGPDCVECGADPLTNPLQIDHYDPDGPDTPANLRLLCPECNRRRRRLMRNGHRGTFECVPKLQLPLIELEDPTEQAKAVLPYEEGSAEMKASAFFEPQYRAWVLTHLPLPKPEAIASGAEEVGCSLATAERYLRKLTSRSGALFEAHIQPGLTTIMRKPATGAPQ
ncbi:MAG: HNH endonuclease signature motif containing protein [Dehalococcoidia bacterium]